LQTQKQEVDRLLKLQSEQERIFIQLVNRIDNVTTGFEKHTVEVKERIKELEQKVNDAKDEQIILESELELKKIQRPDFAKAIPQEWLESYQEMQSKVPDPVVPLSHESCSGCFSILTAADLQLLRKNNLVRCKICFRLIYPETQNP
jgi:predicted  nucleic acid-binding Zn-ribbon protein